MPFLFHQHNSIRSIIAIRQGTCKGIGWHLFDELFDLSENPDADLPIEIISLEDMNMNEHHTLSPWIFFFFSPCSSLFSLLWCFHYLLSINYQSEHFC